MAQYKSIHQTGRDKESHAKQIINVIRKVENSQYARLLSGLSTPAARAIPIPVSIGPVCWVRVVGPVIIAGVVGPVITIWMVSVVVPVFTSAATTATTSAKITVLTRGLSKVFTIERIFAVKSFHFL